MDNTTALAVILLLTAVTFTTRVVPFLLFGRSNEPKVIPYLEQTLPPAVMVILVLYCLKDIRWDTLPHGIPELLGVALVAVLHAWRGNVLLSIGAGTGAYMVLLRLLA
jgi:branched-subunit amino acid transport protein AzlD